jgi:hypothetical protein
MEKLILASIDLRFYYELLLELDISHLPKIFGKNN